MTPRLRWPTTNVLLRFIAIACVALVLAGQGGRFDPALDPFNAVLAPLLPFLSILIAMALRRRDRVLFALAGIGMAVGAIQLGGAMLGNIGAETPAGGRRGFKLRLLTQSAWHANPDPDALARTVNGQGADVAVLQETDDEAGPAVDRMLPGYHRLESCDRKHCSLTILSRWPLRRIVPKSSAGVALPDLLVAEIMAPFGTFRLIDVHLPRPGDRHFGQFERQLSDLARQSDGVPLIVAGDFNTATGSFGLSRFARATGLRRIEGFLPTYPAHWPVPAVIGIDHVFVSRQWRSSGCRKVSGAASDHHGIACLLRPPMPASQEGPPPSI